MWSRSDEGMEGRRQQLAACAYIVDSKDEGCKALSRLNREASKPTTLFEVSRDCVDFVVYLVVRKTSAL